MMTKTFSRRDILKAGAVSLAAAALPAWMPKLAFAQPYDEPKGDVLVAVFLRGAADMLNVVVPYGEDLYYRARPKLAIPRPDANGGGKVLDLDGFFGLHPAMAALLPIFQTGEMAAVHAAGSPDETRSHFEAMDFMERGTPGSHTLTSGWIGRHLGSLNPASPSPVRAIGWGAAPQASLRGPVSPIAMQSILDYHLGGSPGAAAPMLSALDSLYQLDNEALYASAQATTSAIQVVKSVGYEGYQPQHGAVYPETDFAKALRQTAALIRAQVGLEASCIDLGGWDTHVDQGGVEGRQAGLMKELADGLAAFHADLGPDVKRVSLVVMSEFGRRVHENGGQGTDHGHGSAMLVLSGNLGKGPVVADWPTLAPDKLDRGEDLAVTTDYRTVLSELVTLRLKNPALDQIFPQFQAKEIGLFKG
jgi:uncharacterized protein (DUF1501 family)